MKNTFYIALSIAFASFPLTASEKFPLLQRWERTSQGSEPYTATAYENGNFTTVSESGNIFTSRNALQWDPQSIPTSKLRLYGVHGANGQFVALGDSRQNRVETPILASTNGSNWELRASGITSPLYDVTFGAGKHVAVGHSGKVLVSETTKDWQKFEVPGERSLYGVTFGENMFVAAGVTGHIYSSLDGKTWTERESGVKKDLNAIAYGGGKFVAVGDSGTASISRDGIHWKAANFSRASLNAICYDAGMFVAVGAKGTLVYSSDAVNWTTATSGSEEDNLTGVTYNGLRFVAVGSNSVVVRSAPFLKLETPNLNRNEALFSFKTELGRNYSLMFSTNLVDWHTLATFQGNGTIKKISQARMIPSHACFTLTAE